MEELGKTYELVVYQGDNHPIILNREDRLRRTIDWYENNTPVASVQNSYPRALPAQV